MKLPVDIKDIMNTGNRMAEERERPIRIAVFVDVEAADELVDAVQQALRPQTSNARLHVEAVAPGEALIVEDTADAVVAIAGPNDTLVRSLEAARDKLVPTVVVALGEHVDGASARLGHPILDTVAEPTAEEAVVRLGAWLADRVHGKRLALASNFAFVRRAVAHEAVRATAFQNGVIGAVAIIPGADMPLMTANQAKMVLQIAAAYGVTLGTERIKELAAVVGGAFVFREVARQLLDFIPVIGWAVKGAIGYSGTLAMGYSAIEYFESGEDLSGLAEKLKEARDKAVESARVARDRVAGAMAPGEPILATAYVVADSSSLPEAILDAPVDLPEGEPAD